MSKPKTLIINSPYTEPTQYWQLAQEKQPLELVAGRRPAGYMIADQRAKPYHDRGIFVELPLVNQIRRRVDIWRHAGYAGITSVTKTLLEHWQDREQRNFPFFFCQLEAIETLIWLVEAAAVEKTGINIPTDGGNFCRWCSKLATGTGKTVVMAMLIAWQVMNRSTYPRDKRFSRNIFIVTPNLTVRERLAVLDPAREGNYYEEFGIAPLSLREKLQQANIVIRNWHALNWESAEKIKRKKGVDKRGAKSDEAYTREVLGHDMATARNLIIINDEAHHAWRVPAESQIKGIKREEIDEATKWLGGLDRLHKTRGILNCFDFSATPFAPSGKTTSEEALFGWIVSDFGLNDAIESGLVKTPRIVVREDALPDAKTYKPRLYHIYNDPEVKDDLNRNAEPREPLPDLVTNAYVLLGSDWEKTKENWSKRETPPVMITVANRTETAARIKYAFDNKQIMVDSLCERQGMLHIDSQVLKKAEEKELATPAVNMEKGEGHVQQRQLSQKEQADRLRQQVNTVGQPGKPGEQIQNVISVGMLSEGWDARTVTHIMGLRAFTSQLLCEQVVGRGLRRASYEIDEHSNMFAAEYVNVFGVPFSFLPHEETDEAPMPPSQKITVHPAHEKKDFAISWPNVIRIEQTCRPQLSVDWMQITPLLLDASKAVAIADIAPTVDNQTDLSKIKSIDLDRIMEKKRRQTIMFEAAQETWRQLKPQWRASPSLLMAELVRLAEQFLAAERIQISPDSFHRDEKKRKLVITLNMRQVIQHFWQAIKFSNTEKATVICDSNHPIRSTAEMFPWRTGKPCEYTRKSHINYCVYDSSWEASDAFQLDRHETVAAWVKNDHLGFDVLYVNNGVVRKYRPDFLVQLKWGDMLVLETKGQQTQLDSVKHTYMKEWIEAVNQDGRFGRWHWRVARSPKEIKGILMQLSAHHQQQCRATEEH